MRVLAKRKDDDPSSRLQGCLPTKPVCVINLSKLTSVLHSQRENVFARTFIQLILLMPIASTFCLDYTFISIYRQSRIEGFLTICNIPLQGNCTCCITTASSHPHSIFTQEAGCIFFSFIGKPEAFHR